MPSKSKKPKTNTKALATKYTDAELAAAYTSVEQQFSSFSLADTAASEPSSSTGKEIATKKDPNRNPMEDEEGYGVDPDLPEEHQAEIRAFLRATDTLRWLFVFIRHNTFESQVTQVRVGPRLKIAWEQKIVKVCFTMSKSTPLECRVRAATCLSDFQTHLPQIPCIWLLFIFIWAANLL